MAKTTTLKNLRTDKNEKQEVKAASVPSDSTIDFILNYSKALKVQKSKQIGELFTVLN